MTKVHEDAFLPILSSLATCGMTPIGKVIKEQKKNDLSKVTFPEEVQPKAERFLLQLEAESVEGIVTPVSVLNRFGSPKHFREMDKEAKSGLPSIANEIPAEYRALAHTLLPLRNGAYANEGRIVTFKNLVPLGEQAGQLVVHLAGVFSCQCSQEEIQRLLDEQAKNIELMKMADRIHTLDYGGTQLREATLIAKESLGL